MRQLDLRLKPELRLAIGAIDMNMGKRLLPGEEVEAVRTFLEDCWAHAAIIADSPARLFLRTPTPPLSGAVLRVRETGELDDTPLTPAHSQLRVDVVLKAQAPYPAVAHSCTAQHSQTFHEK